MSETAFDLKSGMAVYGFNGQQIGTVGKIDGFGSTLVDSTPGDATAHAVKEASSSTGYFVVDRKKIFGANAKDLVVPFPGIQAVVPERGVILKEEAISGLRDEATVAYPKGATLTAAAKERFSLLRPRTWLS